MSDLVGNPEDRFSHKAHLKGGLINPKFQDFSFSDSFGNLLNCVKQAALTSTHNLCLEQKSKSNDSISSEIVFFLVLKIAIQVYLIIRLSIGSIVL